MLNRNPNTLLAEIKATTKTLLTLIDKFDAKGRQIDGLSVVELKELVIAQMDVIFPCGVLHESISTGGAFPDAWLVGRRVLEVLPPWRRPQVSFPEG
jgi:hypothetical protein